MRTISEQLQTLRKRNQIGLMTHVVVGYPNISNTMSLVRTMASQGADFIELQIPFSDPLADGPTIMRACEQSLAQGTRVADCFTVMRALSEELPVPLLFMAYYNTVFRYGTEQFIQDASEAGAAGLIVPDIPVDEELHEHYLHNCQKYSIQNIQVVAPASTVERLQKNAAVAGGFVYCTARQGTTGSQGVLNSQIVSYLKKVRKHINLPLAVGFGISERSHVRSLTGHAEVAVVGSAILDIIDQSPDLELEARVGAFVRSLKG